MKIIGMFIAAALLLMSPMAVAQDTTAPTVDVFPADGATVEVGPGDSFVWIVDAFDDSALVELEVDNSIETIVPQFTVYANEDYPLTDSGDPALEALAAAYYASFGASVTYDAAYQEWAIGFGDFTLDILGNGGITFYIEVNDVWDNFFGDMFDVTDENTFTYTFKYGPYNKDSCKKGGWKNFDESHGFRNQGKCVSYVNRRDR